METDPAPRPRTLRAWRKANGLTLDQLAAKVGVHAPALSRIERGERQFGFALGQKLIEVTGLTAAELLTPDEET